MTKELKRCPICQGWLDDDKKRFNYLVCQQCGHKEPGRLNSVIEPCKEKRGFIMDAWSRVSKL
jgi:primosomal protein N'